VEKMLVKKIYDAVVVRKELMGLLDMVSPVAASVLEGRG
jgi:hypothetical protein